MARPRGEDLPDPGPAEAPGAEAVLEFLGSLWAMDHALQSHSRRMRDRLGVTGPQRLVLRLVGMRPGVGPGELAEILRLHPSTVTDIVDRLEERGFLQRRSHAGDGRRRVLALTPAGRALDGLRVGTVEAVVRDYMESLPEDDRRSFRRVALGLARALAADGGGPEPSGGGEG